jgi:hypothetical protein
MPRLSEILPGLLTVLLTVIGIVALLWWCMRVMRSGRAATYGVCRHCGLRLSHEPRKCPRCSKPVRDSYASDRRQVDLERVKAASRLNRVRRRKPAPDETHVSVFSSRDIMELSVVAEYLRKNGIRCKRAAGESLGFEGSSPASPYHHVLVWSADEAQARELIHKVRA